MKHIRKNDTQNLAKKLKNQVKGITLIALVITIIVLLILAAVSINLTIGENGIFSRSRTATDRYELSEVEDDIVVALSGLQIEYYSDTSVDKKNTSIADYFTASKILDELNDSYKSVEGTINIGTESTLTVTKTNGKTYIVKLTVSDSAGYTIASVTSSDSSSTSGKWYYDSDGNVTNGTATLKIGDIVYYDAVTGATTKTYTSETSKSGYTTAQTFSLADDGDTYTWKVMGVDESTGEILIVLSNSTTTGRNYIKTDDGEYYYLYSQTGYVNGVSELNNICSIFGEGYGASITSKARSMTIEDANRLTGYDPNTAGYYSGTISAYGNKVTYTYVSSSSTAYDDGNGHSGTASYSFTYYDEDTKEWITLDGSKHTSVTLTSTYYNYSKSNYSSNLVFQTGGYYWFGSSCVNCASGAVNFILFYENGSSIAGGTTYLSTGTAINCCYGVRPVVYLSSDISLSGNSTSGWTIE